MRAPLSTFGATAIVFAACAAAPDSAPLDERLRTLHADLERAAAEHREPSEAELASITEAGLDADRFHGHDACGLAVLLRFGDTLGDADLTHLVTYGTSDDGKRLAFLLGLLLVQRRELDGAAALFVAGAANWPRTNREYSTWKRWEHFYGHRDDYEALTRDISLALLRCHETGTQAEREVLADLFGKPQLTGDDVREARRRLESTVPSR
jgi:hypothetical protein